MSTYIRGVCVELAEGGVSIYKVGVSKPACLIALLPEQAAILKQWMCQPESPETPSEQAPESNLDIVPLVSSFLDTFELVFDLDWDFTQGVLDSDVRQFYISPEGTFTSPLVDDERNNWHNRAALLEAYRELRQHLDGLRMPKRF